MSDKKRVLIIDDDIDFVRINQAVLEKGGYEVDVAYSGAEGVEKARENRPDAIILDFMMETSTAGAPVAQVLREDEQLKTVPILLVTAVRSIKPWWKGIQPDEEWLPVDKVLEKPVSAERLLAEIKAILPA